MVIYASSSFDFDLPSANMEGGGIMSYSATSHQGDIISVDPHVVLLSNQQAAIQMLMLAY